MARIIREFTNDNVSVVMGVSEKLANEIYDTLKETNEQLAIFFYEQWRYAKITGHLMVA